MIDIYSITNTVIGNKLREFDSISDATRWCGRTSGRIDNVLAGKSQTAFGYHWQYKDQNIKEHV